MIIRNLTVVLVLRNLMLCCLLVIFCCRMWWYWWAEHRATGTKISHTHVLYIFHYYFPFQHPHNQNLCCSFWNGLMKEQIVLTVKAKGIQYVMCVQEKQQFRYSGYFFDISVYKQVLILHAARALYYRSRIQHPKSTSTNSLCKQLLQPTFMKH